MDKILCQLCDYKDSPDCPHNSNICHSFRSEDKDCLRIVTKTAHLVAQEIFKDYENAFEPTVPMSITYEKHHAIKSKWGVKD
jgi:hypothetical protein